MISKKTIIGALGVLTALSIGATVQADDTTGVVEYTSGGIVFDPDKGGSDPNTQLPTNLDFGAHEIQTENAETWVATTDGTGLPGDGSTLQRGQLRSAITEDRRTLLGRSKYGKQPNLRQETARWTVRY